MRLSWGWLREKGFLSLWVLVAEEGAKGEGVHGWHSSGASSGAPLLLSFSTQAKRIFCCTCLCLGGCCSGGTAKMPSEGTSG